MRISTRFRRRNIGLQNAAPVQLTDPNNPTQSGNLQTALHWMCPPPFPPPGIPCPVPCTANPFPVCGLGACRPNLVCAPDPAAGVFGCTQPCTPPVIIGAVSRKTHGGAGDFDIDILPPMSIESRKCDPRNIVVKFDQTVVPCDGTLDSEVSVNAGAITALTLAGDTLSIEITGVPDVSCLTVGIRDLCCTPGNVPMAPATVSTLILSGDTDHSKVVNILDQSYVKSRLFKPVGGAYPPGTVPIPGPHFHADVDCSRIINILDQRDVKQCLFNRVIGLTCP